MFRVVLPTVRAFSAGKGIGVRLASGHGHAKSAVERAREHRVTLNDLPVPGGSWLEHHNKRNSKWNLLLAISAGTFVVTMYAVWKADVLYTHDMPPLKSVTINAK